MTNYKVTVTMGHLDGFNHNILEEEEEEENWALENLNEQMCFLFTMRQAAVSRELCVYSVNVLGWMCSHILHGAVGRQSGRFTDGRAKGGCPSQNKSACQLGTG